MLTYNNVIGQYTKLGFGPGCPDAIGSGQAAGNRQLFQPPVPILVVRGGPL